MSLGFCGLLACLALSGCGDSAPKEAAKAPQAVAHPKPADLSRYLAKDGLQSSSVVEDHVLGLQELPGATVGEYTKGGKRYQVFLMQAPSVALTAVYLNDIKKAMATPKFVAGYGGYFGEIEGKPVFAFVKNQYVAGMVGLSQEDADAEGRLVAARIP